MYNAQLIAFLLSLRAILMPCCPKQDRDQVAAQEIRAYTRMPKVLTETSGLELAPAGSFWTILDSGAPAKLYRIAATGQLLNSIALPLPNKDWEELARDRSGNLYIGDFGNNLSRRKDLKVYRFNPETEQLDTIAFHWEGQENFRPDKQERNFDCEAFFWYQGQLHFFTKSWGDKIVRHYTVPDQPGTYEAKLVEEVFVRGLVTAADISPDGRKLALLTYGKLYFFSISSTDAMLQQALGCVRIPWAGQSESVLFLQNNTLILGNETRKLFYVQLHP